MGATTKPSSRVGMPICWMFCALRVRDETEFAGGRRATHSSAKLTKKKNGKSVNRIPLAGASQSHQNTRATEKKSAPAYTEIKGQSLRCTPPNSTS